MGQRIHGQGRSPALQLSSFSFQVSSLIPNPAFCFRLLVTSPGYSAISILHSSFASRPDYPQAIW